MGEAKPSLFDIRYEAIWKTPKISKVGELKWTCNYMIHQDKASFASENMIPQGCIYSI